MKLQSTFMVLLVIALVFAAIGGIVNDFRTYYPEAGNVSTSWETEYSYTALISPTFLNISADIEKISEEDQGWKRILGGLIVFAKSTVTAVLAVLVTPGYIIAILTSVLTGLYIPANIITILSIMIIGSVIFFLVKFLNRSPV